MVNWARPTWFPVYELPSKTWEVGGGVSTHVGWSSKLPSQYLRVYSLAQTPLTWKQCVGWTIIHINTSFTLYTSHWNRGSLESSTESVNRLTSLTLYISTWQVLETKSIGVKLTRITWCVMKYSPQFVQIYGSFTNSLIAWTISPDVLRSSVLP